MHKNITSQDLIFIAGPEQFRGSELCLTTVDNHRILCALAPHMRRNARVIQVPERSPPRDLLCSILKHPKHSEIVYWE